MEFERRFPRSQQICSTIAMPGFAAPRLIGAARHEPDIFHATHPVQLPKAWIHYQPCREISEDMPAASGTLWLDMGQREWSDAVLAATDLMSAAMPALMEDTTWAGCIRTVSDAVGHGWSDPVFCAHAHKNNTFSKSGTSYPAIVLSPHHRPDRSDDRHKTVINPKTRPPGNHLQIHFDINCK
ncbi:hypothetical protein CXP35_07305 [Komagataeibacter xylinus]|nr:hypothetical protein CXP35_07305 [Komagataeibacter xylinus]